MAEMDEKQGRLVPIGDEEKLFLEADFMLDNFQNFDKHLLRAKASKFTYSSVADELIRIYNEAIQ